MNRNILFRAKRADNGEWVEGSYLHHSDVIAVSYHDEYVVTGNIHD